jgi:hypothetical protein
MGAVLDSANKAQYTAIELTFDDPVAPSYFRFTDFTRGIVFQGLPYDPVPDLQINWGAKSGGIQPETVGIRVPTVTQSDIDLSTFERLSGPIPSEPVFVKIYNVIVSQDDTSEEGFLEFRGTLHRTTDNYQGESGVSFFEFNDSVKGELDVPLGLLCVHHCLWTLGNERGSPCGIDIASFRETVTISGLSSGNYLAGINDYTVPSVPGGNAHPVSGYYHRGYIERGGLRLGIRDWGMGRPFAFSFSEPVPTTWLNQTVTLTPGCDKLIDTCRGRWDQEENFAGFGHAMVPYNPSLESQ